MNEDNEKELTGAIAESISKMLSWDIEMSKKLPNGAYLSIRKGDLGDSTWWVAVFEAVIGNDKHLLDLPPQEDWGEFALLSIQIRNRGLVIWTFENQDLLISELSRLFEVFHSDPMEF